jgi:hypothetical protein
MAVFTITIHSHICYSQSKNARRRKGVEDKQFRYYYGALLGWERTGVSEVKLVKPGRGGGLKYSITASDAAR